MPGVDVLLPTCNRLEALIMAISGIAGQSLADLRIILADQSDVPAIRSPVVQSLQRVIEARGGTFEYHQRTARRGIAEQRDFLLKCARADSVLYLDDDVFMDSWVLEKMLAILKDQGCAFVGAFPAGLSYREDVRPSQQAIDFWDTKVQPEAIEPGSAQWERWQLHRAANLFHVARGLPCQGRPAGQVRLYKVAWIGACVLYDRARLCEVGGFSFWSRLPRYHSGEEVLVQNLLMRRWGGCGIVPSGTYFAELPSTVLNAQGSVDGHALEILPEMVARYALEAGLAEKSS